MRIDAVAVTDGVEGEAGDLPATELGDTEVAPDDTDAGGAEADETTGAEVDDAEASEADASGDPCAACLPPMLCVQSICSLPLTATLRYERIAPNADLSALGPPAFVPLADCQVALVADGQVLARAATDASGHLALAAPTPLSPAAELVVTATVDGPPDPETGAVRPVLAVLDAAGVAFPGGAGQPTLAQRVWAWRIAVAPRLAPRLGGPEPGALGEIQIPISAGSGALALRAEAAQAHAYARARLAPDASHLTTVAVLWAPSVDPPCLSCYFPRGTAPVTLPDGTRFDTALFIAGSAANALAWTPSVIRHELGHWVLDTFSRPPGAGGTHSWIGTAWPPLAWSEGFATFFAQRTLGVPRFFAMQNGTQYWVDLDAILPGAAPNDAFSLGLPFPLPDPAGPLDQALNEAVVAAILYDLADGATASPDDEPLALGDAVLGAVAAPRLVDGAHERGALDGPDLVDLLDALVCSGAATTAELTPQLDGFPYTPPACAP